MMVSKRIGRFLRDRRGAIAAEFGLVISVLIVILMGCFEAGRYILLNQKLDRAASAVADLVAQTSGISDAQLADIYIAAGKQVAPFAFGGEGNVIVSSVWKPDIEDATVVWQRDSGGSIGTSAIGGEGDNADMPGDFTVGQGENVIVAEVFYDYEPFLFPGIFEPKIFRHASFTRPRGSLLTAPPT